MPLTTSMLRLATAPRSPHGLQQATPAVTQTPLLLSSTVLSMPIRPAITGPTPVPAFRDSTGDRLPIQLAATALAPLRAVPLGPTLTSRRATVQAIIIGMSTPAPAS